MSMCLLGLSGELKSAGVAVQRAWPRTTLATAAVGNLLVGEPDARQRTPKSWAMPRTPILTPARNSPGVLHRRQGAVRLWRQDFEHIRVDRVGAVDVGLLRPGR